MIKPTETEVRHAVESSGFPLEIRVAHALAARGFEVTPSWIYADDRTGESREIDVAAWRWFNVPDASTHRNPLTLHLLIECKRSPAFVIYSAQPRTILTGDSNDSMSLSYFGRPQAMWMAPSGMAGELIVDYLKLGALRWKWPDCVGSHFTFVHTVNDQQKSNPQKTTQRPRFKVGDEEFYQKKLLGLLKGSYAYRKPYDDERYAVNRFRLVSPHFLIPVLVVDADMYEYDVASTSLRKIARGALCRSYWTEFSARFRIDVVQEEGLSAYLDDLEQDFSNIASQIGRDYSLWEQAEQYDAEHRARREERDRNLRDSLDR